MTRSLEWGSDMYDTGRSKIFGGSSQASNYYD